MPRAMLSIEFLLRDWTDLKNGYCESFNVRTRDELLNSEVLYTLRGGQIPILEDDPRLNYC